jgi:hypothetical protein
MESGERRADRELEEWLATATGAPREEVQRELEEGRLRRDFVVAELVEAGLTGTELLHLVLRLTGLDEVGARALIAAHQSKDAG